MVTKTIKKVWSKEEIKGLLSSNDTMVGRSLVQLYNKQTSDEQTSMSTRYHNNRGFNGVDAHILSSFTEQYQRKQWLSEKQLYLARKKLGKYVGQLTKIANGRL